MVKFHIFALTAASVLSLASARACTTGLSYCGYNLRNLGESPPLTCADEWDLTQTENSRRLLLGNRR